MNKEKFWQIIEEARTEAGNWRAMFEPLIERLSKLDTSELIAWQAIMNEYHSFANKGKLWAAAAVMMGGCTDSSFDYFRGWLIAQGKDVYLAALREPDSLTDTEAVGKFAKEILDNPEYPCTPVKGYREKPRFEEMLYAAREVYICRNKGDYGFHILVNNYTIPEQEYREIESEICYPPNIDAIWYDRNGDCNYQLLEKLLPKLYKMFIAD